MQHFINIDVETITNGPLAENCYLVVESASRHAIIVDPGDEARRINRVVEKLGAKVSEIVCTHGHIDHAGAVAELKTMLGAPFAIHPLDRPWIERMVESATMLGFAPPKVPSIDRELANGQQLLVGDVVGRVMHTPGHTLGGCCFFFPAQRIVFAGDTLFASSVGRTDLAGGSHDQLLRSIRDHLLSLDDDVLVFCGHGKPTTIGRERRSNPFLRN